MVDEMTQYLKPDFMTIAEDMSYNHGPMLSGELFAAAPAEELPPSGFFLLSRRFFRFLNDFFFPDGSALDFAEAIRYNDLEIWKNCMCQCWRSCFCIINF